MKNNNKWARLLAYVAGLVNHQLLLQNEYLAAAIIFIPESRSLSPGIPSRPSTRSTSGLADDAAEHFIHSPESIRFWISQPE
jgi:hypothetical protein